MSDLSERKAELQRKRAALKAQMQAMVAKEDESGEAMSDEDQSLFGELKRQVDEHDGRIARIEDAMDSAFGEAVTEEVEEPKDEKRHPGVLIKNVAPVAKGIKAARFIMGAGMSSKLGIDGAARYIKDTFNDKEVANALVAKTTTPLGTTAQGIGGALVPPDFRQEVIDLLWARTCVRGSGAKVYPMPYGNMTIPRISTSSSASWNAEATDIATTNPTCDDITMLAKRLTSIVPVDNELLRRSPLLVQQRVLDTMLRDMALAEDLAFLFGTASTTVPGGIISLTASANVISFTTGTGYSNALTNLFALVAALEGNNVRSDDAVWYFHPYVPLYLSTVTDSVGQTPFAAEIAQGKLLGRKFYTSTQFATNLGTGTNGTYIILAQPDHLIIGDTLEMYADNSGDASYMLNGTLVSAYSRNQTLFRAMTHLDFNIEHPSAVAYTVATGWTLGNTGGTGLEYGTQAANTSGQFD